MLYKTDRSIKSLYFFQSYRQDTAHFATQDPLNKYGYNLPAIQYP